MRNPVERAGAEPQTAVMDDGRVAAVSLSGRYSFSKPVRDEIVLVAGLGVTGDVHAGATIRHRHRLRWDRGQPNLRQVHLIHAELFDELSAAGWAVSPGQLGENVTTRGIDLLALPRGTVLRFGPHPAGAAEAGAAAAGGDAAGGAAAGGDAGVEAAGGDVLAGVLEAAAASKLTKAAAAAVAALVAAADRVGRVEREHGADERAEREHVTDGRAVVVVTGMRTPCAQIDGFQDGLLAQVATHEDGRLVHKAGVMAVVLRGGPIRPGDPLTVELPPLPHEPLGPV